MRKHRWHASLDGRPRMAVPPRRMLADRRGFAVLEVALLTPIVVLVLAGLVQLAMVIYLRGNMQETAETAAYRMSIGELTTLRQVTSFVGDTLQTWAPPTVDATWPDVDAGETDVTVIITVSLEDAVPLDPLGLFESATMPTLAAMPQAGLGGASGAGSAAHAPPSPRRPDQPPRFDENTD